MKPMMNCCEVSFKCLARMKGCWDPEFEPSVDHGVSMIYMYGNFLNLLSLVSSYSGGISLFNLAHSRWRSHSGQLAQATCPNICNTEHAQFVDVFEVDSGWHAVVQCDTSRDVVSFSLHPESQSTKRIRPTDEVIMIKLR